MFKIFKFDTTMDKMSFQHNKTTEHLQTKTDDVNKKNQTNPKSKSTAQIDRQMEEQTE
jgi:hypothetical protein